MIPLIDCDILLYEVGFISQYKDEETGEIVPLSFDTVIEKFEERLMLILELSLSEGEPILFLTGDNNFRKEVAVSQPYKGNRKQPKPFHYYNLKAYVQAHYDCRMVDFLEADDLMSITQLELNAQGVDTIICSRDKDLRMIEGWHFGWEVGKQPQYGPRYVDKIGELDLDVKRKIVGNGLLFFYSQLITGDKTDNIGGIPKGGDVLAYNTLVGCSTELQMYEAVSRVYEERIGEGWEDYMREQAYLLWMVQGLEDGQPIMWRPPNE